MDEKKIKITEAAEIAHVTRQAIYVAIKKGRLKAWEENGIWMTTHADLQAYRESKHIPENRLHEGKQIYDIEQGRFSVSQATTLIAHFLKMPYHKSRIYYLIKMGQLPVTKAGKSYVVARDDIIKLIKDESGKICDPRQLRFA